MFSGIRKTVSVVFETAWAVGSNVFVGLSLLT
jgi:hypothetical protein